MLCKSSHDISLSHSYYVTTTTLDARINVYDDSKPFSIEKIRFDDTHELEQMSKFCIGMFFNQGNASVNDASISRYMSNCGICHVLFHNVALIHPNFANIPFIE